MTADELKFISLNRKRTVSGRASSSAIWKIFYSPKSKIKSRDLNGWRGDDKTFKCLAPDASIGRFKDKFIRHRQIMFVVLFFIPLYFWTSHFEDAREILL